MGLHEQNGVVNLEFISSTMANKAYLQILKINLQKSVKKLGIEEDYMFQHDNDPKHTAYNTRLWLSYNVKNKLKIPPQSPDLNPIEHLWDLLVERCIRNYVITSKEMLKAVLT